MDSVLKELSDLGVIEILPVSGLSQPLRWTNSVGAFYTLAPRKKTLKLANIEFLPARVAIYSSYSECYFVREVACVEDIDSILRYLSRGTLFVIEDGERRDRVEKDMERLGGIDYWEKFVPAIPLLFKDSIVRAGVYDDIVDPHILYGYLRDKVTSFAAKARL